jgi:hypothetical protein
MTSIKDFAGGCMIGIMVTISTAGLIASGFESCHDEPLLQACKTLGHGNHLGLYGTCEICTAVDAGAP